MESDFSGGSSQLKGTAWRSSAKLEGSEVGGLKTNEARLDTQNVVF